jgi:hypothetical protein
MKLNQSWDGCSAMAGGRIWIFMLAFSMLVSCQAANPKPVSIGFEAPVTMGHELDPVLLNRLYGRKEVPNQNVVESLKGSYEMKSFSFPDLKVRNSNLKIYIVALKEKLDQRVPPDMAGTGPFYLVKSEGQFFVLTTNNFAKVYSPLEKPSQVVPYLQAYENQFIDPFCRLVHEDNKKEFLKLKRTPPSLTQVSEQANGYTVKMIIYVGVHIEAFFEKTVTVTKDGQVKLLDGPKLLQKLGDGVFF